MASMVLEHDEADILNELDNLDLVSQEITDCDIVCSKIDLNKKKLNIMHANIRSIHKNFNDFLVFLEAYKLHFCDVIIFSETWSVGKGQYHLEGYDTFHNDSSLNKNDGVVVFVRSSLRCTISNIRLLRCKVTISKITLHIDNIGIGIACVYRPPSTDIQSFLADLEVYFSDNLVESVELFVGDINVDISTRNSSIVNLYLSIMSCNQWRFLH